MLLSLRLNWCRKIIFGAVFIFIHPHTEVEFTTIIADIIPLVLFDFFLIVLWQLFFLRKENLYNYFNGC